MFHICSNDGCESTCAENGVPGILLGALFCSLRPDFYSLLRAVWCIRAFYVILQTGKGSEEMKLRVEQVGAETPEEVLIRCHDPEEPWVGEMQSIAAGQVTVNGVLDGKLYRLKLGDIYYFEVVDGGSFLYCQKEIFSCKQRLYEFEALCSGTMLFRCSKSMILNAEKIDYVLPSLSGRFEAVLDNGEKVIISRQYVSTLKRLLGR